jgi:hypothetical protein
MQYCTVGNENLGNLDCNEDRVEGFERSSLPSTGYNYLRKHPLIRLLLISCLAVVVAPVAAWAQGEAAAPISGVLGKVEAVTSNSIDVQTKSGVVHVAIEQPLTTYRQVPSDLSHVTSNSYVGIPSVNENGKEVAKQVLIFPAELRGAAEGSVLLDAPPGATTHSRMTNGSVSGPAASQSRMTNGTVQKGGGTTLMVRYQDGEQTIRVPANVPVAEVAPQKVTLGVGDTIYAATTKQSDGALTTNKIFMFVAAEKPKNAMQ